MRDLRKRIMTVVDFYYKLPTSKATKATACKIGYERMQEMADPAKSLDIAKMNQTLAGLVPSRYGAAHSRTA